MSVQERPLRVLPVWHQLNKLHLRFLKKTWAIIQVGIFLKKIQRIQFQPILAMLNETLTFSAGILMMTFLMRHTRVFV